MKLTLQKYSLLILTLVKVVQLHVNYYIVKLMLGNLLNTTSTVSPESSGVVSQG